MWMYLSVDLFTLNADVKIHIGTFFGGVFC